MISVGAQLLLYQLVRSGNLVNVTSLFHLVPVVTAAMDFIVFGHRLSVMSVTGMLVVMLGLMLVFKSSNGDQKR